MKWNLVDGIKAADSGEGEEGEEGEKRALLGTVVSSVCISHRTAGQ